MTKQDASAPSETCTGLADDSSGCGCRNPDVRRLPVQLYGDESHVVHLPFIPVGTRLGALFERIGAMSEDHVEACLKKTLVTYGLRHANLSAAFEDRYRQAQTLIEWEGDWSRARRCLAGAYLTMEYAIEAVALLNPSIVPHPSQDGLADGAVRFLMSLRAIGEGHVSSIVFRTGTIDAAGQVQLAPQPTTLARGQVSPDRQFLKHLALRKLREMGLSRMAPVEAVMADLEDSFTIAQLNHAVAEFRKRDQSPQANRAMETLLWLARSNYRVSMPAEADISQLVLYPVMQEEAHGVEDLRLVRFINDDGSAEYFGTYAAYDGRRVLPMLIRTRDFRRIGVHSINGAAATDKGMALFPRKVNGHYVMCGRIDGENLHIMYSDFEHFWESAEFLAGPHAPWNLMQLGNCGSPIETPEGWLLLTHGVGPMRTYAIGAMLLDLDDPLKVRGRLDKPLISPLPDEQYGHVPNVVYTCGAMIHAGTLYMPFALTDHYTTMCAIDADELVQCLLACGE